MDPSAVRDEAEHRLRQIVAAVWRGGWQPRELVRQVRRGTNPTTVGLALTAVSADHAGRAVETLDSRWVAQITELDLPTVRPGSGWLAEWQERERVSWRELTSSVAALVHCIANLASLPTLIPPPGARASDEAIIDLVSRGQDPVLDRVRALLAQAESTTFEAEAETFTAKAQEIMTRHAIDAALLFAPTDRRDRPITIRLAIDDPYADVKSLLLQYVAEHSRCRSVCHDRYGMSSVIGLADDVATVEMLFTSLLVQAQGAMRAAAATAPPGSRARSRAFRSAFLISYAQRVSERLAAINAAVIADVEAETHQAIYPVLAARTAAVDAVVEDMFGDLRSSAVRRRIDSAGWVSGRLAADRAKLNAGDLAPGRRAIAR